MLKNKKLVLAVLAITLVGVIAISFTLAYFTDSHEVTNTFTLGDLDIDLDEPVWKDGDGDNLAPGDIMIKDPVVYATTGDGYMRLIMTITDENGITITDTTRLAKILETLYYDESGALDLTVKYSASDLAALGLPQFNDTSFELDTVRTAAAGNGVYVYNYISNNGIFEEGSDVQFMSHVVIPSNWNQSDFTVLAGPYKIIFRAEAVQAKGFADAAEAFTALDAELNP